ncbi:MAG: glycosyltransferase 9 family protein [Zetaproteobacteria bacterium]|nr:MAG: glycosyltransferase 9 family protein [Zetaproteobacteria bacterium]
MIPNSKVQNILFITSSRIGDAVLSSGLINYMQSEYPDAQFTICCGPLAVSLFEGVPRLERIISINKQKYSRHWIDLWKTLVATRFDIVVDLRNSAVSRLIRARQRHIYGSYVDKSLHKVEQNASVMRLLDVCPSPKLWFSTVQCERAEALIPDGGAVLGVGPTANWIGKTWPEERFIEVIKWLIFDGGLMAGARVAVFAAPGEEAAARTVLASIPVEQRLDIIAKTDPGTAAATIARCDFYLGNDSGLMHCAAAANVATFGLFGPSYPHIYSPWGAHTAYASTPESFDELIDYDGYTAKDSGCLMMSLSVEMVKVAIEKSWPQIVSSS